MINIRTLLNYSALSDELNVEGKHTWKYGSTCAVGFLGHWILLILPMSFSCTGRKFNNCTPFKCLLGHLHNTVIIVVM